MVQLGAARAACAGELEVEAMCLQERLGSIEEGPGHASRALRRHSVGVLPAATVINLAADWCRCLD